jgi:CTP:molybdopterin cytidylyltransferase MocA
MSVAAVLLAAGGASRFRSSAEQSGLAVSHKLIAPLRGETVFSWSLRNLLEAVPHSDISEVMVVQGALDLSGLVEQVVGSRNLTVRIVTNSAWADGQATSLALASDSIRSAQTSPLVAPLQTEEQSLRVPSTGKSLVNETLGPDSPLNQKKGPPHAMVVGLGDQPFIPAETWTAIANAPAEQQLVVATYGGLRRNPVRIAASLWDEIPRTGDEGARPLLRSRTELVHELPCNGDPADIDTVEDLLRWS